MLTIWLSNGLFFLNANLGNVDFNDFIVFICSDNAYKQKQNFPIMPRFLKKEEDSFHSKVYFYSVYPLSLQASSIGVVGREERKKKSEHIKWSCQLFHHRKVFMAHRSIRNSTEETNYKKQTILLPKVQHAEMTC